MPYAILWLACCVAAATSSSVNYCGAKMCGHTNTHTFCQYYPGASMECRGYMEAALSAEEQARVLARLNLRRSETATGRLPRLPPAGNMLKLRWVEELAREAQRWADQCRPASRPDERDSCRDLYSTTVGQCVASVVGEAPGLRVESMVDVWYMQSMMYRGNATSYILPMSNVSYYGDFAQMIWARSYMVGCGRSRFMAEVSGRLRSVERLVCNIAPRGPPAGRPLWAPARPAAVCPPRSVPDPDLPGLCNFQADIDPATDIDATMSIEEHVLLTTILEMEDRGSMNYIGGLDELYLTKLALVTMDTPVTADLSYYNPIHKRDILDKIGLYEDINQRNSSINVMETNKLNNDTEYTNKDHIKKGLTIKANLIGRPKPYDLDDLSDVADNSIQLKSNYPDMPVTYSTLVDPDLYLDYSTLDLQTDNIVTNESSEKVNDLLEVNTAFENTSMPAEILVSNELGLQEYNASRNVNLSVDLRNSTVIITMPNYSYALDSNMSLTYSSKSDEDYLNDPETAREIQEALDRMEHSLQEAPESSAKVRRDLREMSPGVNQVETRGRRRSNTEENLEVAEQERNRTKERVPMLNMVLKYLPYLKPYRHEILGTASRAPSHSGSNVLFSLILYFPFVV